MRELSIVCHLTRGINGRIDRVEHAANKDRAKLRLRPSPIQHRPQISEGKVSPWAGQVEEKLDARAH
jgi:hypothetical protein